MRVTVSKKSMVQRQPLVIDGAGNLTGFFK